MQHSHRLIVALVTALGLILTSVPGLAHAADWTDANTKSVNYRQKSPPGWGLRR